MDWVKGIFGLIALSVGVYLGIAAADVMRALSDMHDVWDDEEDLW